MSESSEYIRVFARIKPSESQPFIKVDGTTKTIFLSTNAGGKQFGFNDTFGHDSEQVDIFNAVGQPIVDGVLNGFNGTIFAYGQTGSGKTYTMNGPDVESDKMKGLIPRCLEYMFNNLYDCYEKNTETFSFEVSCSFIELYNENIHDLLEPDKQPRVKMNINRGFGLENVATFDVASAEAVMQLLKRGCHHRHVAETNMNRESSRSHSVFIISVTSKTIDGDVINIKRASLNLVDLAGSERQSQSKAAGERLKEATHINQSLTTLARVIRTLSKKASHVPYRDSILTLLLSNSLGGNSRTAFVLTMHPDREYIETSLQTANFAQNLKLIKNNAHSNEDTICEAWKKDMVTEIARCRTEMARCQEENVDLKGQVANLTSDVESLKEKLQQKRDLLKELTMVSVHIKKFSALKLVNAELKADIVALHGQLNDKENAMKDMESESSEKLAAANDQILQLQKQVKFLQAQANKPDHNSPNPDELGAGLGFDFTAHGVATPSPRNLRRATIFDLRTRQGAFINRVQRLNECSVLIDDNGEVNEEKENELPEEARDESEKLKQECINMLEELGQLYRGVHTQTRMKEMVNVRSKIVEDMMNKMQKLLKTKYEAELIDGLKLCEKKLSDYELHHKRFTQVIAKLKHQLEETNEEKTVLMHQAAENAGHHNKKQKVQYINTLRQQVQDMSEEIMNLKMELAKK